MSVPPLRRLRQAPRHLLVCEKGHARHARSRHAAHVRDHAYNCRVSAPAAGAGASRGRGVVLTDVAVGGREEGAPAEAVTGRGLSGARSCGAELPEVSAPPRWGRSIPSPRAEGSRWFCLPAVKGALCWCSTWRQAVFWKVPPSLSKVACTPLGEGVEGEKKN